MSRLSHAYPDNYDDHLDRMVDAADLRRKETRETGAWTRCGAHANVGKRYQCQLGRDHRGIHIHGGVMWS